jgi:hypothetical protein
MIAFGQIVTFEILRLRLRRRLELVERMTTL